MILVTVLVEHSLELVDIDAHLIHDDGVMRRPCCALDSTMRAEVNVIVERVSDISIDDDTWHWVAVLVGGRAIRGEKANMMTLFGHNNGEFWL